MFALQDPTIPALELLKVWCNPDNRYGPYLASLPQPGGADLTITDFFTDAELDMLQWPPLVQETRKRMKVCHIAYMLFVHAAGMISAIAFDHVVSSGAYLQALLQLRFFY
jgi:hypothetical protein